jgi:membrane protein DedA with SNARE-associated domain
LTLSLFTVLLGIALSTLVSEDATVVATGVAVGDGLLGLLPAVAACAAGIYLGDLGLWLAGRVAGRRALTWRRVAAHRETVVRAAGWIDRHPALALFGSRIVPGTRLPLYIAAGAEGTRPVAFALWSLVAVLIWTPIVVSIAAAVGSGIGGALEGWPGTGWRGRALLVAGVLIGVRYVATRRGTRRGVRLESLTQAIERWRRWEFWPSWLFNLPVVLWVLVLAVRYRSITLFTLANPGIPDGGFVGESKSAILAQLPDQWVMPWTVIAPGALDVRLDALRQAITARRWNFPLVFKPDVGQRGAAVRWVSDEETARNYLDTVTGAVVVQLPHDGPFEAGVFYVRRPSERHGRIFSITDKRFPMVIGDGTSTVAELVESHDRYRLQSRVFRARLLDRWHQVPAAGERVALGRAGNHCQGTEFLDGQWLATPALERRVDSIAKQFPGFFFGRFDVRYRSREGFMTGQDFAIVELNGVTSEATHIYDPSASLPAGWRTLMRQWSLAFAIGAENRARGLKPASVSRLTRAVWTFARSRGVSTLSD